MLLNDIIVNNQTKLSETTKKQLVSVFPHLTKEDQGYILDHLESFVQEGTTFFIPSINDHIPSFLTVFVNFITINKPSKYYIKTYDASVEQPAVFETKMLVISPEIPVIYRAFSNDSLIRSKMCNTFGKITLKHPSDLFLLFDNLALDISTYCTDPTVYVDCVLVLSKCYDIIMRVNMDQIGLDYVYPMEYQALSFKVWMDALKKKHDVPRVEEFILLELNILSSLVSIDKVADTYKNAIMSPKILKYMGIPFDERSIIKMINVIKNGDSFTASKPIIKSQMYHSIKNTNRLSYDLREIIKNTTRDKIKDVIESKTGVIEDIRNITFNIPQNVLTMYQLEFSKEHPIMLTPIPTDCEIDPDGSNWRHIISFEGDFFIAFAMRDSKEKIYAIRIYTNNSDEDESCTILEFTGKKGASYKFIY